MGLRAGRRQGPRLYKVAVYLFEDDWRWLGKMCYRGGPSETLRTLLREYRQRFETTERRAAEMPVDLEGL